ncbi:MAG: glycoside hydrolase family 9 protein [Ruminococcus flavefaciens]|nr:glycoside hydrolase family 9 protein [Ruminococcus flavefaciens]MCM1228723.1 glycoside hydrolase family 9 protein [Ruminococcus flavefaciens]
MRFTKKLTAMTASAVMAVTSVAGSAFSVTTNAADLELDNYAKLLQYSLYFYDANYCGIGAGEKSHFSWRDDCHTDNTANGGFHDAGDGIICGITEGFTASTLGWIYYEYKDEFEKTGTATHLKEITSEFAQFIKNCTTLDGNGNVTKFIYEIGDDGADHGKWRAPELMSRSTSEYYSTTNGASNVAAQYAAALAQQYINFGDEDSLKYAKALYDFATKYRTMTYDQQTYSDKSVEDDIAWAAGWLYIATNEQSYLEANSKDTSNTNDWVNDYYYGGVWLGAAIINAEITGNWDKPVSYINSIVNANQNQFYIMNSWGSARHNALMQTCAMVATKHNDESGADFSDWCKKQMNMILGDNNANVCLVVGYNDVSATSPHHRAASGLYVSDDWHEWNSWDGNYANVPTSHVLYGALCGGPTGQDFNTFQKLNAQDATSNEVALDYQVGLVGAAAGLYSFYGTGNVVAEIGDEITVYAEEIAVANGETPTPPETTVPEETTTTTSEETTTTTETTTTEATTTEEVIATTTANTSQAEASIVILSMPNKTVYEIGEELNLDGAMASASGTDSAGGHWDIFSQPVTSPQFVLDTSEFDNTKAGTYKIYVSVMSGGGATTSFEVEVKDSATTDNGGTDVLYGDANEDGIVDVADAAAIIQSLGNKDKYALSAQGAKNADVYNNGDGVTGMDALVIQKVAAHMLNLSDLPVRE